ncbi:hypothetical protein ELI_0555 [Eubacterium callanderi]|uniref:Uncharacterized protein n=1 Tax=Eubacterium callanderi TaxID=53442 RepID=E3GIT6_9FIRM|nr:hypothetical protein ELI_0555 [Eubacterium callanderi]
MLAENLQKFPLKSNFDILHWRIVISKTADFDFKKTVLS